MTSHMTCLEPGPPQDLDAEQGTLGAMLIEPGAVTRAMGIVSTSDFYREVHRQIFSAMRRLYIQKLPVDLTTVSAELRRRSKLEEVGGGEYLTALINEVPTAAHVTRYATIVAEKAVLRQAMAQAEGVLEGAHDQPEDIGQFLVDSWGRFQRLYMERVSGNGGNLRSYEDMAEEIVSMAERAIAGKRPLSVARLGVPWLDRHLGPLEDERVIVLKAFQGEGKTHLSINAIMSTATEAQARGSDAAVIVFSFESRGLYPRRCLAWQTGINSSWLRRGFSEEDYPEQANRVLIGTATLADLGIVLHEGPLDEVHLEAYVRQQAEERPLAMVVLDYWQAIGRQFGRREVEEYEAAAYHIRDLADEFRLPILVLSQLTMLQGGFAMAKGSRTIEEVATLSLRLQKGDIHMDKSREVPILPPRPLNMDKTVSRIREDEREVAGAGVRKDKRYE